MLGGDLRDLEQLRRAVVRDDRPALDVVHRLRRHFHREVGAVVRHEAEQLCTWCINMVCLFVCICVSACLCVQQQRGKWKKGWMKHER